MGHILPCTPYTRHTKYDAILVYSVQCWCYIINQLVRGTEVFTLHWTPTNTKPNHVNPFTLCKNNHNEEFDVSVTVNKIVKKVWPT